MARSSTENLERLQRRVEDLRRQLAKPEEANRAAAIKLHSFVIRNFQLEGRLVAGGWPALKPATIKQKARLGYTKKLVRTGDLKNSFTPFSTKDIASVRSDLDYAADHEFGVPSRNLPARKMTPSLKQAAEIGIEVYNQFVQRQIKKVGFK